MDVVVSIDIAESCTHNYLCRYVNLWQHFKSSDCLENLYVDT